MGQVSALTLARHLALFLALIPGPGQALQPHPWDRYAGCYQTLSIDGQPLENADPLDNRAQFKVGYHGFLLSPWEELVPSFNIEIFIGVTEEEVPGLPPGRWRILQTLGTTFGGSYSRQGNTDIYEEEGEFLSSFDQDRLIRVRQSAKITPTEERQWLVELQFQARYLDGSPTTFNDLNRRYELRRCPWSP